MFLSFSSDIFLVKILLGSALAGLSACNPRLLYAISVFFCFEPFSLFLVTLSPFFSCVSNDFFRQYMPRSRLSLCHSLLPSISSAPTKCKFFITLHTSSPFCSSNSSSSVSLPPPCHFPHHVTSVLLFCLLTHTALPGSTT